MKRTKRMCMNDLMESLENEEKNSDLENNTKILKELVEQIKILNVNIQQLLENNLVSNNRDTSYIS